MPATSRSAGALLAPLGEVALRLALEVDDHHVVLRDQHLAEMVVAVDARLEAGGGMSARRLERAKQRRACGEELPRPRARTSSGSAGIARSSVGKARSASSRACVDPARDVRARRSARRRRPDRRSATAKAACSSPVRLPSARAEIERIGELGLGAPAAAASAAAAPPPRAAGRRTRRDAARARRARRPRRRPGCARSRRRRRAPSAARRSGRIRRCREGRRVRVAGDLGQEARHLDLRLLALAQPPVDLQHRACRRR